MTSRIGLSCAVSTPVRADGAVDLARLAAHGRDLLARGCDSLTMFGTTGEGASLSLAARHQMLGALAASGVAMRQQVIAGIAAASIDGAVAQGRAGYEMDCRALLVAPPFFFGGASDDGLFRSFAAVFDGLGGRLRDVILYHIPGMTRNAISVALTRRLMEAYLGVVIGATDISASAAARSLRPSSRRQSSRKPVS